MNRCSRTWILGVAVAGACMVPAALAWACVGLMSLTTSTSTVQPGGTVTVFGKEFAQGAPIQIHLDSPAGAVLATVPPPTDTMTSQWSIAVTIPPQTPAGDHVLVATQAYHYMNAGAPARASIHVGAGTPASTPVPARPARIAAKSGPSAVSLVLIGLAVAAIGLLAAALWSAMAGRSGRGSAAVGA